MLVCGCACKCLLTTPHVSTHPANGSVLTLLVETWRGVCVCVYMCVYLVAEVVSSGRKWSKEGDFGGENESVTLIRCIFLHYCFLTFSSNH